MSKKWLLIRLEEIRKEDGRDREAALAEADKAIMEFIDDEEIYDAYDAIDKRYAR